MRCRQILSLHMGVVWYAIFEVLCALFVKKMNDYRMANVLRHFPCTCEESSMLGKACGTPIIASNSQLPNMVKSRIRV